MLALSINSCCQMLRRGKYSRAIDPASADAGGGGVTMIACWLTIRPSLSVVVSDVISVVVSVMNVCTIAEGLFSGILQTGLADSGKLDWLICAGLSAESSSSSASKSIR